MESEKVRATAHYIWKDADTLGCGSFGMVFRGCSKDKGEPVAVKTLKNRSGCKLQADQHMREIEMLRGIDHPNVVKLIAVEDEISLSGATVETKVLVLELADTTLHHELERPENAFGLRDRAFLLLLSNLASGLSHLRQVHKIIHRDLKPSNILKTVDAAGKTQYKLCDFGGARTVTNDDEAMYSLVGTEEYIHPAIHEGVIRGREQGYTASCDLWSIGVTLYQAAAGKLPFCPTGGARNNRLLMLQMTTKKPPGAISGYETAKNCIEWSKKLPSSAQLSEGLRPRVTMLLGGLMETNRTDQWTYERFFLEAGKLTRVAPIKLFHFDQAHFIYLYETASFNEFAADFNRQISMSVDEYFFWTGNRLLRPRNNADLNELIDADQPACFAIDTQCKMPTTLYLPCSRPKFSSSDAPDLSADVDVGKVVAALAHFSAEETLIAAELRVCASSVINGLRNACEARTAEVERRIEESKKLWSAIRRQLDPVDKCIDLSDNTRQHLKQCNDSAELIRNELCAHETTSNRIKTQVMTLIIPAAEKSSATDLAVRLARSTKIIDDVWMQFRKEKGLFATSFPTDHEQNWHRVAKERMKFESEAVFQLIKDEKSRLKQTIIQLTTPFKTVAAALDKMSDRLSDVHATAAMIDAFQDSIAQVVFEHFSEDHNKPTAPVVSDTSIMQPSIMQSSVFQDSQVNASMKGLLAEAVEFREITQQTAELMKSLLQFKSE